MIQSKVHQRVLAGMCLLAMLTLEALRLGSLSSVVARRAVAAFCFRSFMDLSSAELKSIGRPMKTREPRAPPYVASCNPGSASGWTAQGRVQGGSFAMFGGRTSSRADAPPCGPVNFFDNLADGSRNPSNHLARQTLQRTRRVT